MPKFRIVQIKPVGLEKAFIIEELVHVPITKGINPKYHGNQGYWENTFRLNAGGRPADWFVAVPAKDVWRDIGDLYAHDTIEQAQEQVTKIASKCALLLEYKTFKPKVIQEYD